MPIRAPSTLITSDSNIGSIESDRYPCAIVVPNGPCAAMSLSTWIHWWSPVASANRSMCRCSIVCQSLVPSSRSPAWRSAGVSVVATTRLLQHRAQRLAVDLANGRQRDVREDPDLARVAVAADAFLRERDELARRRLHAVAQRDECHDLFAVPFVGPSDDADERDCRVLDQRVLDVAREDVEPAADDQILPAVDDVEVAVRVDIAEVSGVQPPVAHRLRRQRRVAPVALHHRRGAAADLADLARRDVLSVVTLDEDLDSGNRQPDR